MPFFRVSALAATKRIAQWVRGFQAQHRPHLSSNTLGSPRSFHAESPAVAHKPEGHFEDELTRLAWNGSVPTGAIIKRHREMLGEAKSARAANTALQNAVTNRLATLESELAVLIEQPPEPVPLPKVLRIVPSFKGA